MKKITFLFMLFTCQYAFSQTPKCYPNKDGTYQYYVELDLKKIPDEFSLKDFSKLLEINADELSITSVQKSFPTAKTARLQKVVSVFSKEQNIHEKLGKYPRVLLAEQLCHPKEMLLYEPNDYGEYTNTQMGITFDMSHLELINAAEAWNITTGDERIRIGVTDTGLDLTHEDLSNKNIIIDANNCTGNNWYCAHGTEVAGAAAGDTNNNLGLPAIGFNSSLRFSSNLFSDNRVLQMSQTGTVRVINLSWVNSCSFNTFSQLVYDEILNIHNVVVTAGAGNGPDYCSGGKCYPASYDEVISVTSIGHNNDRNTTPTAPGNTDWEDLHEIAVNDGTNWEYHAHQHNEKVNICAPGYAVPLIFPNNTLPGGYGTGNGTSYAAPIVAGVCALVAAVNPCLTSVEIMDIVLSTADAGIYNLPRNYSFIGQLGTGRVDAYAAVLEAVRRGRVNIQNTTLTGTNTHYSETSLFAGYNVTASQAFGNVQVASNSDITFEATHEIVLQHGFEVSDNTVFEAKIVDSNCY